MRLFFDNSADSRRRNVLWRDIVVIFLALLAWQRAVAVPEQFRVHSLYLENELDSDSAYDVIRDQAGFLWIGTDNGLKRYDGYNFKNFVPDPNDPGSLGSSVTISLLVQRDGTFWAGGRMLNRYNPETEKFDRYNVTDGAVIWAMLEDEHGKIWLGGEGFGLKVFDPETGKIVMEPFKISGKDEGSEFISSLAFDKLRKKVWVASNEAIYAIDFTSGKYETFALPWRFDYGTDGVKELMVDNLGRIWLATLKGAAVLTPETEKTKIYLHDPDDPGSLVTNALWSVFQDSKGQIWVGTDKQGVHQYRPDTDSFVHIPASDKDEYAFPPASIDDIFEDEAGNLWFAVRKYGVRRLSPQLEKFRALRKMEGHRASLSFDNVLGLHEDVNGHVWIATDGGGINIYDPDTDSIIAKLSTQGGDNALSSDSVIALAEDSEGDIWAGMWAGGINVIDKDTLKIKKKFWSDSEKSNVLENNNIFRIESDKESNSMWLSVWRRGIQRYEIGTKDFTSYQVIDSSEPYHIHNLSVNDVVMGQDNYLWVGGYLGVERINLTTNVTEKIHWGLIQVATDLLLDGNILWIASSTGFYKLNLDNHEIKNYSKSEGLSDNYVVSIEKDNAGSLWFGTRSGLNRFDPETEVIETFDERDGLIDSQFNTYSHLKTRSGMMYFGGPKGISIFDPDNLPRNASKPKTVLTNFEIFQNSVEASEVLSFEKNIAFIGEIIIPYSARDFTFEFSSLDFASPSKNRYKYKLIGLENDWIEVDSDRRRVRYTNLDPGAYTFEVYGSNNEGIWDEDGASVRVVVLPPWWMTWWARTLFISVCIYFVYIFTIWRMRIARAQETLLRKKVKEKTKELQAAHASVKRLNQSLEQRVEERTKQLSVEIEERKSAEDKLFHMAFHDSLTGLNNRAWLLEELEKRIQEFLSDESQKFGLMFLDGDHFKQVNDTHGHLLGDRLLINVAQRLEELLGENCHAVRLGGDEFTLLARNVHSSGALIEIAERVVNAFKLPFKIDSQEIHFRVTVGMVLCDETHTKPEDILRDADIAMYRAKGEGRGTCQLFDTKMREEAQEMAALERDLMYAIERNEFHLVYQPILDLSSGSLSGFEALLRWEHSTEGFISPEKFIPLAEENGTITTIGLWVLREACNQISVWNEEFDLDSPVCVGVNISSNQLKQLDFVRSIDSILLDCGIDSNQLKLEITESAIMDNTDTVNGLLNTLRSRGIEFAIDDFGTGYSSLSYLDTLPVQYLKIDRQFVSALSEDMPDNEGTIEIVRATISLAHNLNLQVIAEGIETAHQYDYLAELGCDFGQGYFIERPMTSDKASVFIEGFCNVKKVGSVKPLEYVPSFGVPRIPPLRRLRDRRN